MYNHYNHYNQYAPVPIRQRRPGSRARGCGCLFLILALLVIPFIGAALTTGRAQIIFGSIAAGIFFLFLLFALIGMLVTRRGREELREGCLEAILEAILSGITGG